MGDKVVLISIVHTSDKGQIQDISEYTYLEAKIEFASFCKPNLAPQSPG